MSSADNLCKQFGPGAARIKCQAWSGSKLLDNRIMFLRDIFEMLILKEEKSAEDKNSWKYTKHVKS